MEIVLVKEKEQIEFLAKMANKVWHEFFPCILSEEQIEYMLDKFQSFTALSTQIENGYSYFIFEKEKQPLGYMGINLEEDKVFLSKLYILKEFRHCGYAKKAFNHLFKITEDNGLNRVYLTVNKYNAHAIDVYKKVGFQIVKDLITEIGNGYIMDDYVMELIL